ncbi:YCF48-related protein [Pseudomonas chengduensis]|nr:YCF48-related protein [Pseudomonas chengduensis]MDH1664604.1 YCF48-related protein [Pseudomonas chengduensis]
MSWAARLSPWGLIAGLAYAAVFIKPTVDAAPLLQPVVEQRDMFFGAAGDLTSLWVVGQDGAVLHGVQGGTRWSREVLSTRSNLQAVAVSPGGVVVAVGNHGDLWLKTPEQNWRNTKLPVSEVGGKLLDVAFIGGHFWVTGEMGALFRSGPEAGAWERVGEEQDVAFNAIRQGIGSDLWVAAEFGRLLRSRDGGLNWTTQELGNESLRSVSFEGQVGVAVGNAGHVYVSQDGGDNWKAISLFASDHLRDVAVVDGLWSVVGDNGTYFQSRKPDGGWSNAALEFGGLGKGYFTRVLLVAGGSLLVGQQLAVIDGGQLTVVNAGMQP